MFTQFKQKLAARLTKFAYLIVPCGAVIPMMVTEIQEGYLVINAQNVYEVEHKRLYDVLFKNPNLTKGTDSKGNYVKLPDPNGRCIELTSNTSFVGRLLQAALPNITGHSRFVAIGDNWPILSDAYGTFSGSNKIQNNGASVARSSTPVETNSSLNFNSKYSSSIFQDGATVQPNALQVLACVRC